MFDQFDYGAYREYQDMKTLQLAEVYEHNLYEDLKYKNAYASYEREQEMRAFLSDPDYQASLR
jgi:hypothetical protein